MHQWIGSVFFRGIDPSRMGYAELRYYNKWSETFAEVELTELRKIRGTDA